MSARQIPFEQRANLSVPEAMKFARLGRKAVEERLTSGRWRWFWEGARKRVITASIINDQEANASTQGTRK